MDELVRLTQRVSELEAENQELARKVEQATILKDAIVKIVGEQNAETAKFFKQLWDAAKTKDGYFKKTIWYMWRPGDDRDFASTRPPSPEWVDSCKQQGYFLVSFEVSVPDAVSKNLGEVGTVSPESGGLVR